jgi:dihydropteroate synthase
MEAAWQQGASIVNDISALEDDPELGVFAAQKGLPVILMHKQGIPSTMQDNPLCENVFYHVNEYLQQRVQVALSLGIESDKIWLDPGIGFGKSFQANKILVTECGTLCGGKYPVVIGESRKSFVAHMTGRNSAPEDRLAGTLATNMVAVMAGASILRVHDVAATRDMLLVLENLKSERIDSIS